MPTDTKVREWHARVMTVWGVIMTTLIGLVGIWFVDVDGGGGVALAEASTIKITTTLGAVMAAGTAIAGRVRANTKVRLI